jgi:hypothetical protein
MSVAAEKQSEMRFGVDKVSVECGAARIRWVRVGQEIWMAGASIGQLTRVNDVSNGHNVGREARRGSWTSPCWVSGGFSLKG